MPCICTKLKLRGGVSCMPAALLFFVVVVVVVVFVFSTKKISKV